MKRLKILVLSVYSIIAEVLNWNFMAMPRNTLFANQASFYSSASCTNCVDFATALYRKPIGLRRIDFPLPSESLTCYTENQFVSLGNDNFLCDSVV